MKPVDPIKETLVRQGFLNLLKLTKKTNRRWYEGEISL